MFHPCDIVDSFSTLNILVYLVKGFLSECLNIVLLELVLNVSVHEFSFNECDAFQLNLMKYVMSLHVLRHTRLDHIQTK